MYFYKYKPWNVNSRAPVKTDDSYTCAVRMAGRVNILCSRWCQPGCHQQYYYII